MIKPIAVVAALALLTACGNDTSGPNPMVSAIGAMAKQTVAKAKTKQSGGQQGTAAKAATPAELRAQLQAAGKPVLLVSAQSLGRTGFLGLVDTKGNVATWETPDGASFTQRGGVLIQTRGLGSDLMSAQAPSVGQLLSPGTSYQRIYYFLGDDDQGTRRTYDCTTAIVGRETIDVLGKKHSTTHVTETCERPLGKLTNDYWVEGQAIRQSRQWVSGRIGYVEFQRVID